MEPKDTLKQLRQTTNMTQAKFATKFHIPISTYEQWEMGIRKPPVYVIEMIETIIHIEDGLINKITLLPTQENAEGQDMYQAYDVLRTIKEYCEVSK